MLFSQFGLEAALVFMILFVSTITEKGEEQILIFFISLRDFLSLKDKSDLFFTVVF